MAKQFKPKTNGATVLDTEAPDETTVNSGTVEEGVENTVDTVEEVVTDANLTQKSAVKNVKIMPNCNHSCCIGGTRYFLKKGVLTNVPQEVKDVLNKSGLLMPL